jgi:selT/selW/selH-like putative selenoprotein
MADLLRNNEQKIEKICLQPSDGGRFEVKVGDDLIYSKLRTNRHPAPGEVEKLLQKYL